LKERLFIPAGIVLFALSLTAAVGLLGCSQAPATNTSSLPSGRQLEVHRFAEETKLWQAWLTGSYVVWMESAGPVSGTGLSYSGSADWDTVFGFSSTSGGAVQEVPGVRVAAPKLPSSPYYELTLPTTWAAVLSQGSGKPFKLVWAAPPEDLSETYLFHGLSSWSVGGEQAEVLPQSALSFAAQVSGDAVAVPVPVSSYTRSDGDPNDPRNWEKLLMMTGEMSAPVEVDPVSPKLPESALSGLSPYFALLTVEPDGRRSTPIFDLRTGEKLALELPGPPQLTPVVAGHFAAWFADSGDVYLADLASGQVKKVLSLPSGQYGLPSVALGENWLVALKVSPAPDGSSSTTLPSEHPGADLVALHLPDLRSVQIPAVVPKGEVGAVQVSGDVVLLSVSPAIEPMPHNEPPWVALRVLSLQ
jgi:hypothetical protein